MKKLIFFAKHMEIGGLEKALLNLLNSLDHDRYQVTLGDSSRLPYKVEAMQKAVSQMSDYQSGTLDVSFTTWPNEVGYTPFS